MKTTLFSLAAASTLLAHGMARAAEPMVRYDSFKAAGINADRWLELDSARSVSAGALHLGKTTLGGVAADTGYAFDAQTLSFADPLAVTAMAADVVVDVAGATACTANPAVGSAKLRIGGGFFNTATPTPGSAVGDVVAQIVVGRASNSADGAGELRVTGSVLKCLSADCANQKAIGAPVDLGLLSTGSKTRLSVQLDRGIKAFVFQRDAGSPVLVAYTDSDSAEAGLPAKTFSVRNVAPHCASGNRTMAQLIGRIDNVSVNKGAAR